VLIRVAPFGAQVLAERKADDGSGVIINTMGWVEGEGYRLLVEAAKALGVNVVLVLGQDRLHAELDRDLAGRGVDVVKLAKSGGVVTRQRDFRKVRLLLPSS
jgi:polyribonucleotide 5'-hydroxyl-kinase